MATHDIPTGTWQIDPSHSAVTFSVRHLMVSKVRGRFGSVSGTITIGENEATSSVDADIDVATISTDDEKRDQHLRSADFFDVERFPTMTIRSTEVGGDGDGWSIAGDVTIRDVTQRVVFELELGGVSQDPWGNTKAGFSASTTINRKDFGLGWNAPLETGGVVVGDKIQVEVDIEAALEAAPEGALAAAVAG